MLRESAKRRDIACAVTMPRRVRANTAEECFLCIVHWKAVIDEKNIKVSACYQAPVAAKGRGMLIAVSSISQLRLI